MIKYDILICGIGGQGVISLGTILKLAAMSDGLTVVGAERRGGAQREGVVTSNVRYRGLADGEIFDEREMSTSGLIPIAGADMMIAMEPLEGLRHAKYLNDKSIVIINNYPLIPVSVRMGENKYPESESIFSRLREFTESIHIFNIDDISKQEFGSLRQVNTILLGISHALGGMPVSEKSLLSIIKSQFPDYETNKKAFALGKETALYDSRI